MNWLHSVDPHVTTTSSFNMAYVVHKLVKSCFFGFFAFFQCML